MKATELSPNDWATIRAALRVTADARLIDILTTLECTSAQGNALRDDCEHILEVLAA